MDKFQKISSRITIALALIWAVLVAAGQLSIGQSYLGIGILSAYIGIQNTILLIWGQRTGKMSKKIAHAIQHHGQDKGLIQYGIVNILLFLLIGLTVAYCGWQQL